MLYQRRRFQHGYRLDIMAQLARPPSGFMCYAMETFNLKMGQAMYT